MPSIENKPHFKKGDEVLLDRKILEENQTPNRPYPIVSCIGDPQDNPLFLVQTGPRVQLAVRGYEINFPI